MIGHGVTERTVVKAMLRADGTKTEVYADLESLLG